MDDLGYTQDLVLEVFWDVLGEIKEHVEGDEVDVAKVAAQLTQTIFDVAQRGGKNG